MKKKLLILASTLALVPAMAIPAQVNAAEQQLPSGIYFINTDGSQGEYYSYPAWSDLAVAQKGILIAKYGQKNIKPYLPSLNKIASLDDISQSGQPFLSASSNYVPGDLPGEFKDYETGEVISSSPAEENFEVIGIE
ncbi:hypothetical protein [Sporosarcina sp. FSL K6-3457]|uniref:hypothetical protein n=1 Tax=Sporosarcina sp. FSL K6-3457 TaxID=2978204 RepID=UPI0030F55E8C